MFWLALNDKKISRKDNKIFSYYLHSIVSYILFFCWNKFLYVLQFAFVIINGGVGME